MTTLIDGLLWRAASGKYANPAADLEQAAARYLERTGHLATAVFCHPDELEQWRGLRLVAVPDHRQRRGEILVGRAG